MIDDAKHGPSGWTTENGVGPLLQQDRHGETAIDRLADQVENGTMDPGMREDLRTAVAIARGRDVFVPTERETEAIRRLSADLDLSPAAVMRQALHLYQMDHERRKAGETPVWSGDAQRAIAFTGRAADATAADTRRAAEAAFGPMTPWNGGPRPSDWDGIAVRLRSGDLLLAPGGGTIWKLGWRHHYGQGDIVEYSRLETTPD